MNSDSLYSTGRYGVVDIFYRRIWINTESESLAHDIRRVFRNHVLTAVVDLLCFKNFNENLIDSNVSLGWQIPHMKDSDPILKMNLKNPSHDRTIDYLSGSLINAQSVTLLEDHQEQHLQEMMLFYLCIKQRLGDPSQFLIEPKSLKENMIRCHYEIDNIFKSEIDIREVKQQIYNFAKNQFDECFNYSAVLLDLLGRQYG